MLWWLPGEWELHSDAEPVEGLVVRGSATSVLLPPEALPEVGGMLMFPEAANADRARVIGAVDRANGRAVFPTRTRRDPKGEPFILLPPLTFRIKRPSRDRPSVVVDPRTRLRDGLPRNLELMDVVDLRAELQERGLMDTKIETLRGHTRKAAMVATLRKAR